MSIRAKFLVTAIDDGEIRMSSIPASEIPEGMRYHTGKPKGSIWLIVDNQDAKSRFQVGRSFYVDFLEAIDGFSSTEAG